MADGENKGQRLLGIFDRLSRGETISKEALAREYGVTEKSIQLRMHVDEKIIGGVIVKMGDKRIDGSVVGRMQSLKEQLLANK